MKICLSCKQQDENGAKIENDAIISTARKIKQALGIAKNNEPVICQACMPEHEKKLKRFQETKTKLAVTAALTLIIFGALSSIITGVVYAAFLLSLSLLKYTPKTEVKNHA